MSRRLYEEVNCPGNKFKMNQKLPDLTFDPSLLLLCNDETGRSRLRHILMSHTSRTCFDYCPSWAI